ncbi:MAG: 4-hydroxy-tetrahydrodipicolinate reductase [Clostridiales bacterium]|nr:4-hydroxy-tetrahydrodipicolinate reductase [Clostridiales bacterium]
MIKAFVIGIRGKMGGHILSSAESCGFEITGGLDLTASVNPPIFTDPHSVNVPYDVIIDFSRPAESTLNAIKILCLKKACPAVIATTGYGDKENKEISALSKSVPIFRSANFSLGVAAAKAAAKEAQKVLGKLYDVEIVEKHHREKADSPSGTALMLADALCGDGKKTVNRSGMRSENEIGISSVRGGGVIGEHEIGFYGDDEIVTVTHTALSRRLFAVGALKAARFVIGKPPGLYGMDDMISELTK